MFSTQEQEWLKALVETMRGKGYKYYVAHTVTQSDNDTDVVVVFSQHAITGNGLYSYAIDSGIMYSLDSSGYSTYSGGNARTVVSNYSGSLAVDQYEFVYTNADFLSETAVQPDIRQTGGVSHETSQAGFYMLTLLFLVTVLFRFFR